MTEKKFLPLLPRLTGLLLIIVSFYGCAAVSDPPLLSNPTSQPEAAAIALKTLTKPIGVAASQPVRSIKNNGEIDKTFDQLIGELDFYAAYSRRLGIPLTGTENKDLILAIDEWLGTQYRWGGCSKAGVDCSCLVKSIYENVYGIQLNRNSRDIFHKDLTPVDIKDLREGDILTFKIRGNRISHVGLYLKDQKFVHASLNDGVTIDDLTSPYYWKRFYSGGRIKDDGALSPRRLTLK